LKSQDGERRDEEMEREWDNQNGRDQNREEDKVSYESQDHKSKN
jgi:hypothetical protein